MGFTKQGNFTDFLRFGQNLRERGHTMVGMKTARPIKNVWVVSLKERDTPRCSRERNRLLSSNTSYQMLLGEFLCFNFALLDRINNF
mmetsp:Transcript_1629/g.2350  ORF Transcript_1629/g.2350 Transcript_1629/m.2350 type:complete len:87 (-) Transcript_1629:771-1031(-)